MEASLLTGALALGFTLILVPPAIRLSHARGAYDMPSVRTMHDTPVPVLGGTAIVVALAAAVAAGHLLPVTRAAVEGVTARFGPMVLLGLVLMHAVGALDDAREIPAFVKLALQLPAALLFVAGGVVIETVRLDALGFLLELGPAAVPVTVLWIVGVSTAVNLIDGLDGFAPMVVAVAAAGCGTLSLIRGAPVEATAAFLLAGAMLGFLPFNLPPARIFMGDGGSLFAGAALAILTVPAAGSGAPALRLAVAPVLLALPIIDIFAAVVRRAGRGLPLYRPDREHVHHLLLHRLRSEPRALVAGTVAAALPVAAVTVYALLDQPAWAALPAAVPPVLIIGYIHLDRRFRRRVGVDESRRAALGAASAAAVTASDTAPAVTNGKGRGTRKAQAAATGKVHGRYR